MCVDDIMSIYHQPTNMRSNKQNMKGLSSFTSSSFSCRHAEFRSLSDQRVSASPGS